ncbi:MAG: ATP-dependent zinc metalloprotease FtsH [Acidimicrobiia bacterium]|nr:ATP-dependent zinc metalloprotease FtsH [Acidimicrobiia bacterium]
MNSTTRLRVLLLLLAIATAVLVMVTFDDSPVETVAPPDMEFGAFAAEVDAGRVAAVDFTQGSNVIVGELRNGESFRSVIPPGFSDELVTKLLDASPGIDIVTLQPVPGTNWFGLFATFAPLVLMVVLVWAILTRMNGGKKARKKFTAKTRKKTSDIQEVTFADVAGAHEAVIELSEIKEFLSDPERFQSIGAQIPKGVLLYGPPGTGKTLLARAVAGEAGVPFFTLSGSDFVEMYAGVGASRVRDLFDEARKQAPAIIFVDEIDAVGRHRGGGGGAGNEEREQTLNQLLVEMDGFDADTGVIFIAATNRPDVLDPALLRPGRFDRQVGVERPDLSGRREIIAVHAKGKPLGPDADPETIARRTPGFTGADLANLLNESALLAARRKKTIIGQEEIDDALDRVIAGPEKGSTTLSDKEKYVIAYHEAGHALVGHVLPNSDPIHKVSIIARGKALGWTLALPDKDRVLRSRSELSDEMAMLLGGRIAEELIFGDPTTGAANDIERVTAIARSMVTDYGMSPKLGLQKFGLGVGESYAASTKQNYSDVIASKIDDEVRTLVDAAADEARELLTLHRPILDRLAEALIDQETLNRPELDEIFSDLQIVAGARAPFARADGEIDLRGQFSAS